jgi:hypothetical protein
LVFMWFAGQVPTSGPGGGGRAILGGENDPDAKSKGWRIDQQLEGKLTRQSPFYAMRPGKSSSPPQGYDYKPTSATIEDAPYRQLGLDAGGNQFIDVILGMNKGKADTYTFLGSMTWGWKIGTDGAVSFIAPSVAYGHILPPELAPALDRWNAPGGPGQIGDPVITPGNIT